MALKGLSGKVAVVTGAAGGIGEGTARRLAEEGASVVVDVQGERARAVAGAKWVAWSAAWRDASPTSELAHDDVEAVRVFVAALESPVA